MRFLVLLLGLAIASPALAHGGGLNSCGCHFNRKTGECHCHRNTGCGCECQPGSCGSRAKGEIDLEPASADMSSAELPIVLCKDTRVRGYTKKDGTYVEPHYRTKGNDTKSDNYSTKGNVNPYTGEKGSKDPWAPSQSEKKKSGYDL